MQKVFLIFFSHKFYDLNSAFVETANISKRINFLTKIIKVLDGRYMFSVNKFSIKYEIWKGFGHLMISVIV